MSNPHAKNVTRAFPPWVYSRPAGAAPTPQTPWRTRRLEWVRLMAPTELGGMGKRFELGDQHPDARTREKDLARLIEEGLAIQEGKPQHKRGVWSHKRKFVVLTEAGLMLWETVRPQEARVAEPYAKRRGAQVGGRKP